MIGEAFQPIAFVLCLVLSHRALPHYTTTHAKSAEFQTIYYYLKKKHFLENYLKYIHIYMHTWFDIYLSLQSCRKKKLHTFSCILDWASSEHQCHCTMFCFVSPAFIQISQQMLNEVCFYSPTNNTKQDLQGYLSKLTNFYSSESFWCIFGFTHEFTWMDEDANFFFLMLGYLFVCLLLCVDKSEILYTRN